MGLTRLSQSVLYPVAASQWRRVPPVCFTPSPFAADRGVYFGGQMNLSFPALDDWHDGTAVLTVGGQREAGVPVRYRLARAGDNLQFEIDRELDFPPAKHGGTVGVGLHDHRGMLIYNIGFDVARGDTIAFLPPFMTLNKPTAAKRLRTWAPDILAGVVLAVGIVAAVTPAWWGALLLLYIQALFGQ